MTVAMTVASVKFVSILVLSIGLLSTPVSAAPKTNLKKADLDWSSKAEAELVIDRPEAKVRGSKKTKKASVVETLPTPSATLPAGTLPTPATVRAEVPQFSTAIERTALRFALTFESYQPRGAGEFVSGDTIDYGRLPSGLLAQADLRWLPFSVGALNGKTLNLGGYTAFGYSRQEMPLVAPSGFRYDDVALNTLRYEAGFAAGLDLTSKFNLEARLGFGRLTAIQSSRFTDLVGTFHRPFAAVAVDLSYHIVPRFAFIASLAHRSALSEGTGAMAFDPLTVSGGFLVQVR